MKTISKKSQIAKVILLGIVAAGGILVLASVAGPGLAITERLLRQFSHVSRRKKSSESFQKKQWYNAFYYLKKQGLVKMEYRRKQLYISLTSDGEKKSKRYALDSLILEKPKKWDHLWRVVIFDIVDRHKLKREALRGKLIQLGFLQLQKSVWLSPYPCSREVEYLRSFFGITIDEMKILTVTKVEGAEKLEQAFKLS